MRLVHQTFLVLLIAVLVAVAAMAALFAIGLERGFVDYVNQRQAEQLDSLQAQLVDEIRHGASLEVIARNPRIWRRMLARSAAPEPDTGEVPGEPAGPPRWRQRRPPLDAATRGPPPRRGAPGPLAREDGLPRVDAEGRPAPPPADPLGLNARVVLLDAERVPVLAPRPPPPNADTAIDRPIVVDDRTVAWIRSWPVRHVDRPEDIEFLQTQYARIGWAAGALLLLAAAVAPLVARRLTRPLHAIARATERIARGEFEVRLPSDRRDEIGELMGNVDRMAESLQRLERSRREWLAEISHELRTPLTVLRAEIEGLEDGVRPFDARALASLREETAQLARLVDDLHQLALADLGAFPCTMAATDLCAVTTAVVARYRELAAARGLALSLDAPARPVPLHGDAQRLEQLLSNLLDNSLRYTEAPGRIAVRLRVEGGTAMLAVEDSAPGVDEADLARLFEPLYRGDAARRRDGGGSGLGLAIARAIVVAHGGRIAASASPLGGLAVSATLPLSPRA